ncbi:NAD(+) diphosphatase [Trueperella pecoris]|uniref:NAD(+) diphosphatase n=2 Tax=Trueperella pecoris TaxID=2733571 RepID=A0A7M1QWD2_9ACTO|nr:NAD(+) diphosphatase [Trueperella pecoris]QOQ39216.1 NAD(+) diphosphatase [Trueperella pecoris]QOR46151.1 NAD(+) diphosphatase [Trueperella pecoris]
MYGQLSGPRKIHDRDGHSRCDMRAILDDDRGRYLLVDGDTVSYSEGSLAFLPRAQFTQTGLIASYLGTFEGVRYLMGNAGTSRNAPSIASLGFAPLREVGHLLSDIEAALAMEALALANWQVCTKFCSMCGKPTRLREAGWHMECEEGHATFPRIDPAVIMAIRDGHGRILLGRNRRWRDGRFSTLAGFVEAGESVEDAVRREVWEEAGVRVGRLEYVASQPWPYPRSLMVGLRGWTVELEPSAVPDGVEIAQAGFFTRGQVRQMFAADPQSMPGPTSLARALMEDWYGGPLEEGGK